MYSTVVVLKHPGVHFGKSPRGGQKHVGRQFGGGGGGGGGVRIVSNVQF